MLLCLTLFFYGCSDEEANFKLQMVTFDELPGWKEGVVSKTLTALKYTDKYKYPISL